MRETEYLKENKNALEMLRRIEKFQAFSQENIESFLEIGKLREYDAGETIIRKGDTDQWAYFLLSGEVKIVKGEKTFAVLNKSGELFGEMGVIDGSPRSASAWAQNKTLLLGVDCAKIPTEQDRKGVIFHYTIFRLFAECLAERLRLTNDEVLSLQKELKMKDQEIARLKGENTDDSTLWI